MIRHPAIFAFWLLYTGGTILLIWSMLFAQAPSRNHTPYLIQFTFSAALLVAAGVIGFRTRRFSDATWPSFGMIVVLASIFLEILFSLFGAWDSLTHLHSL